MESKKLIWTLVVALLAVTVTSCNLGKAPQPTADVNAIYTSAAQTMVADLRSKQTQTAQAMPPTATATPPLSQTPLPTFMIATGVLPFGTPGTVSPLSTLALTRPAGTKSFGGQVGCNAAIFIGETKPYDGTFMTPGKVFEKGWSMFNSGTCSWDEGFSWAFKSGDRMQGEDILISQAVDFTKPQHSQAFIVQMQVPSKPGEYKGFWQMKNDTGVWFGDMPWVDIIVGGKGTQTPTPTKKP